MEDHLGYSLALLVDDDIRKEDDDLKMEPTRLQCHVCCKVMGHRSSLYKHLKYIHKIEPAQRLPISCREKECTQSFTFIDPFRRHLAEQHGFNIVVEKYVFQTMKEFFAWKKLTEQEENMRYIVSTGPRNSKGGKTHYYRCQKNGTYKPEIKKRLQSDDGNTLSRTHCISSMCVFEESDSVTVEFCRTHYGHEMDAADKGSAENSFEGDPENLLNEHNLSFETIDTCAKLNSFLSKKDRAALTTILSENQHLLQETEELFYENEQDVMLKIPFHILRRIFEEGMKDMEDSDAEMAIATGETDGEESDEDKDDDNDSDSKDSTILESLGNGIFFDPKSNKRLKLGSIRKKLTDEQPSPSASSSHSSSSSNPANPPNPPNPPNQPNQSNSHNSQNPQNPSEQRRRETERHNTMLVKEYLNEFDEKVYVLEPVAEPMVITEPMEEQISNEETIIQKREKILSQLQSILMMVNSEEDMEVLDEIETHLSRFAVPE